MADTVVTFEDALHEVENCTECRQWVAPVLRDEYAALREASRDIYAGYAEDDNALYNALNRHRDPVGLDSELDVTPFGASHHIWRDPATGTERQGDPIA